MSTAVSALRARTSPRLLPWRLRSCAAPPAHGRALTRSDERARAGIQVAVAVARLQVQVGGRPARRRARRRHRRPLCRLAPLHAGQRSLLQGRRQAGHTSAQPFWVRHFLLSTPKQQGRVGACPT